MPRPNAIALADRLPAALDRRRPLIAGNTTQAMRLFSGAADGLDGVFVDVYGPAATLIVYDGRAPSAFDAAAAAQDVLAATSSLGVRAVYLKPFAKDRSHLGGALPAVVTDPTPLAGEPMPEAIAIREHAWQLEIRPYDGLSTGLFLDQRDNRRFVYDFVKARRGKSKAVLNTFAYTCAFSVAAAMGEATTTSVDVSARYLDWGRRNFALNGLDAQQHRFATMDTFEFFNYARRKDFRYDLIVLDPPSYAAGNKRRGTKPFSSVADYARLVREAAGLLDAGGTIFASTNTQELCRPGRLEREIAKGLGRTPRWVELPPVPIDFARDKDRFAARAFRV